MTRSERYGDAETITREALAKARDTADRRGTERVLESSIRFCTLQALNDVALALTYDMPKKALERLNTALDTLADIRTHQQRTNPPTS